MRHILLYIATGLLASFVIAAVIETITYNILFIPNVRAIFEKENRDFLDNNINYGEGHLTILAPLAFRSDCAKTYYGCFSWDKFPGADVVVAFQGTSAQEECIRVE